MNPVAATRGREIAGAPGGVDLRLGATHLGDGRTAFKVWAPNTESLEVVLVGTHDRRATLAKDASGYFAGIVDGVHPGAHYLLRFPDGRARPDPASRFQPEGVSRPSEVVDNAFAWTDKAWQGLPLADYVMYELHVGTFTREGTFDAVIGQLDMFVDLGITAIELMPIAQFPGARNWGYDGVHPYAAQNTYGGPSGLKRLVDAAHARGIAVVLDVVYNHLGPEGNYLNEFGHYFTDRYHTPWGQALNFDGPHSDEVRRFFIENALEWVTDYHIDALRLDAIHAIVDESARPFLLDLARAVRMRGAELNRHIYTIAESNRNDPRHVAPIERGGYGMDAQWNDDFEHALRVALTGQCESYYCDYTGLEKMAKAYREGFVFDGGYSQFRRRHFGAPSHEIAPEQLVVFTQNHDQVGNRPFGERLSSVVDFQSQKLAAAAMLLSPYVPMLFMGEEYAEPAPFCYFVSHNDPGLREAVRRGRMAEFPDFQWPKDWPDPCRTSTFNRSRLKPELRTTGRHAILWSFYRELIRLRKSVPALRRPSKEQMQVSLAADDDLLLVWRWEGESHTLLALNFADQAVETSIDLPKSGAWRVLLDSADPRWEGPGAQIDTRTPPRDSLTIKLAPRSVLLLARHDELRGASPRR